MLAGIAELGYSRLHSTPCNSTRNQGSIGHGQDRCRGNGKTFRPDNTLVIASGTSNAAGTSLRALEADRQGLIDGLVVIEPNINPDSAGKVDIDFGGDVFSGHGTSLYDNHTLMAVYAACAELSSSLATTPFNLDPIGASPGARANRCAALRSFGLLAADGVEAQADEARAAWRQGDPDKRRSPWNAIDHPDRPKRRAGVLELSFQALLRPQSGRRRREEQAPLYRGCERPAFRSVYLDTLARPRDQRRPVRAAALFSLPGAGPDA
jgi:hypothetical protein